MEQTWRWYGPSDEISLGEIRQTGAKGIVTALHEIQNGEIWSIEEIEARRQMIEAAGLRWSVVESVPVPEAIKQGRPERDRLIENFNQTLCNLASCGIKTVCYNFMPLLDWSRTDLAYELDDGALALRFDRIDFMVFDLYLLQRPGAQDDYSQDDQAFARERFESLTDEDKEQLLQNLIAGLPGADEHYTLERFKTTLADYNAIGTETLRENLCYFLQSIIPVAESAGVKMAIHPDDPPFPLMGLPRIVSTAADAQWLLQAVDSPANGLTFCTGSYGVRADNDLPSMIRRFAERIHFVHLRATKREEIALGGSFHEAAHLEGDVDMVAVITELLREEKRRKAAGGSAIPMRPDHGHRILDDQQRKTAPGYPLYGRMRGLAELRGIEYALAKTIPH